MPTDGKTKYRDLFLNTSAERLKDFTPPNLTPNREPADPKFYDPFTAIRGNRPPSINPEPKAKPPLVPAALLATLFGYRKDLGFPASSFASLLDELTKPAPILPIPQDPAGTHISDIVRQVTLVVYHHCESETYQVYTTRHSPTNVEEWVYGACIGRYPTLKEAEDRCTEYTEAYEKVLKESFALQNLNNLFSAPQK
jgi:hypothetical protein